jgi:DMSO reductase anchor subunit
MHPAPSIVVFTVLSGLGFGLLAFLGLGFPPVTGRTAFAFFAIAFALAGGGLLASTFHLGHPERALKAFTQWRSSWLSREAWGAVATLTVMGLYSIVAVFFDLRHYSIGLLGAVLSLATVLATSMIYAQLRAVPRWHHASTPILFLLNAIAGGALIAGQVAVALPLLAALGAFQIWVWGSGDRRLAASGSTLATATGLGGQGSVRAFEPPHTGTNYLLNEMAFVIGRRHAVWLRIIGLVMMSVVPCMLLAFPQFNHIVALVAVVSHVVGVLVCRWLFFAEAEHVMGLYYGRQGVRP